MINPQDYPRDRFFLTKEQVMEMNPHRHEFQQCDGVLHFDKEGNLIVARRDVLEDEFWVRGHIPGRPIFPGVLMCETLAQVASIHAQMLVDKPNGAFIGFGAIDEVRFRGMVTPGTDLWVAGTMEKYSSHRTFFKWRGNLLTADGSVVCSGLITGMAL